MEELRSKDLLFVNFSSLGLAYKAAQLAPAHAEIMEIFPLGSKGHIAFFAEESLANFAKQLTNDFGKEVLHLRHIEACSSQILKAYFSVDNAPLEQSFVIFESEFIGELIALANQAITDDLRIVDLRLQRGTVAASTLFVTGTDSAVQIFAGKVDQSGIKSEVIAKPTSRVRDFFSIQA